MLNYLKKIFSIFLIFNLTFVSSAQAAATFVDSFSVVTQENNPTGLTFNNDGTKMFVSGNAGNDVGEYSLTTAFDVSTATFVGRFEVVNEDNNPSGVAFNNDGTKMFVTGFTGDNVYEYTLSTGFDLTSTVSFVDSFDVSTHETAPGGLTFNNEGTKMFVVGENFKEVIEYTLTTPFDVSSASFVDSFDVVGQVWRPRDVAFNNDGTKMFVVGHNDEVDEFILSTGFDLSSTITYVGAFNVSTQDDTPTGVTFNNDGTKMFVVGSGSGNVNEYTLSCAFKVTASSTCDAPPKIKEVRGIVDAQINTAKNFAKDSSQSALKRLANLRAKDDNKSAQKIELNFQNETLNKISNNVVSSPHAKKTLSQQFRQLQKNLPEDWALWTEGSISFGKIGENSLSSAQDIDSLGITVGVDTKIDDDKILGVALRVGNTDVDVGTYGSKVDTNALSLSVYGSNSFDDRNFLEHVIGASYLDSDITRKNQGNTNTQTGDREGKQVFGSLNFGREYEDGDVIITPTGRIDGSYTALDSYTENGNEAIRYNDQDIKSLMASLGVLIDEDINLENSNVRSRINLEYSKEFASNSKVVTSYVSDSEDFEYQADNKNRDIYTAGLGFDFKHDQGLTISTDYERQQIKGHGSINKFTLSTGFLYRKETELALDLSEDMTSNFKISKALDGFDLEFNLENDFSNQENHNANLSLSSKF
jgi:outer membrane autotransporter protein